MNKIPSIDLDFLLSRVDAAVEDGLPLEDAERARTILAAIVPDLNRLTAAINATVGVQAAEVMGALTHDEVAEKLSMREKEVTAMVSKLFEDHLSGILGLVFGAAHRTVFRPGYGVEREAKMVAAQAEAK